MADPNSNDQTDGDKTMQQVGELNEALQTFDKNKADCAGQQEETESWLAAIGHAILSAFFP